MIKHPTCGTTLTENIEKNRAGIIMVRGTCPKCDRWVMWIPYKDSDEVNRVLGLYVDHQARNGQ